MPSVTPVAPGLCSNCVDSLLQAPGPFTLADEPHIVAAREYGGDLIRAMEALKIAGRRRLATGLALALLQPLYRGILETHELAHPYPLVPVPAGVRARRRRGFDQAVLLARELSPDVLTLVVRRRGASQKELNREERALNASRQYAPGSRPADLPTGVIIVDDVVTTGASIMRCGEIVQEMGIREWHAIALAVRL